MGAGLVIGWWTSRAIADNGRLRMPYIKCSVAKAALPKLVTEKPYGQVRRSALIKPPAGFKPCGVSFTATSKKIVTIECTKKQGTSMIFQRK
jgi:hypothetical protein